MVLDLSLMLSLTQGPFPRVLLLPVLSSASVVAAREPASVEGCWGLSHDRGLTHFQFNGAVEGRGHNPG